ncbi:MAG: multicopper oxidase family protein [Vulcanimicrobiaceae bacterium]
MVFLEDYTSRDPAAIWKRLAAPDAMAAMPGMSGARPDLNDVDYDAYLANRKTFNDPEIVRVERGAPIRLRVVNASSGTNYTLDLGALRGTLVAVDGRPVVPIAVARVPLATAQRADVLVRLPEDGAFPIVALREGAPERSGIVLATPRALVAKTSARGTANGPVLGYAFERSLHSTAPLAARPANVNVDLRLTGLMGHYVWGINGRSFPMDGTKIPPSPVTVKRGDRVRVTFSNQTSMSHPMHLHGHAFQVIALNGSPIAGAMRDTVVVPTLRTVEIAFDADNPGTWMLHCHNAWHLQAGMATTVKYVG